MKIYTKKGDGGETTLYNGDKVSKCNRRVDTYGTVDEANSFLGAAKSLIKYEDIKKIIHQIQQELFVVSAELATTDSAMQLPARIHYEHVERLETLIDQFTKECGGVRGFVTPGESLAASFLDISRTVVRRMERLLTGLAVKDQINANLLAYINRLSDLLFIMARVVGRRETKELVTRLVLRELERYSLLPNTGKGGEEMKLTLEQAQKVIAKAQEEAEKIGIPMVIAVVDDGGNLKSFQRMDEALLASVDIAINKAYTALALKMPTHQLAEIAQPGQELYGIEVTNRGRIVTFGGGYPIYLDGSLVGAIGVSGGSVEQDKQVAEAGIKALN
ncbi:cob(I)yrinic acid a,c-diamide adenosyltransferase [Thermincola potens]|uniref:Corrinoid adenosyltransferase n=1 Tax=Thermincola potens (strain JR) TaxID=635013 RepID=D5XBV4_THEPJ|nr:cob(I)yrinic acid a,c-diamide adenosyltransferase [Thermincola potens]ADG81502.1 ATP/cobalamin adenosyltransferase [Thermincola potens JR]